MAANKQDKTNVMRVLDSKKIAYNSHTYDADPNLSGSEIADILGEDAARVFKTLVTQGKSGQHYVFVVPVQGELNLKKAAEAAHEKSISMIKQKDLLPLTGYVHGGCSPIGMKKSFPTIIDSSAQEFDRIYVSAGKVGCQIELDPQDLAGIVRSHFSDIT